MENDTVRELRQTQTEDFQLIMGALADQRDAVKAQAQASKSGLERVQSDLLVVANRVGDVARLVGALDDRLDASYAVLEQGLFSYLGNSLKLIDAVGELDARRHASLREELDEINERLNRLEKPPAA